MDLFQYDKQFRTETCSLICGVDEAGRGPLAGPVYAAAVILPADCIIEGLNDSKKVTERRRGQLFDEIIRSAVAYGVASADEEEIDSLNILQASLLAMRRAVDLLQPRPHLILVDGNQNPEFELSTKLVVKGDAVSACIAAASILAKVSRDRRLLELDREYPAYQFAKHKGYPTKLHYQMLDLYGESPVHRRTFLRKWKAAKTNGGE